MHKVQCMHYVPLCNFLNVFYYYVLKYEQVMIIFMQLFVNIIIFLTGCRNFVYHLKVHVFLCCLTRIKAYISDCVTGLNNQGWAN